jgi:hypothetical protein
MQETVDSLMRSASKKIALLALLLTLWSAFAFAAHHHSSQEESASCQVCVAAHSASPAIAALPPKPIFRSVAAYRPRAATAKQRLETFASYVRPPPSA